MGFFENTDTTRPALGRFQPKQDCVTTIGFQRRAINRDKSPLRPCRCQMDRPRHKALAGPRRSADQNTAVGCRHLLHGSPQMHHRLGSANNILGLRADTRFQLPDFFLEMLFPERPFHVMQQDIGFKRLCYEVVCAHLGRRDGHIECGMTTNHYHLLFRIIPADDFQGFQAIHFAVAQPYIQNDQGGLPASHRFQRFAAVHRLPGPVAAIFQGTRNLCANIFLVVDDQNIMSHVRSVPFLLRVNVAPCCPGSNRARIPRESTHRHPRHRPKPGFHRDLPKFF